MHTRTHHPKHASLVLFRFFLQGQPTAFVTENQRSMLMASGVRAVLTGARAMDMLEKLVYLILPNQVRCASPPAAAISR